MVHLTRLLALSNTRNRVVLHLVFWIIFLLVRFYLILIGFNIYNGFSAKTVFLLSLGTTCFTAGCYYFIVLFIFRTRSWIWITLSVLTMFLLFTVLDSLVELMIIRNCKTCLEMLRVNQPAYYELIQSDFPDVVLKRFLSLGAPLGLLLLLFVPLAAKMASSAYRNNIRSLELEKENLQLQHNYLKAQLNPHFLFNSMNNIYGLINSGQNDRSADLVSRLSQLLRYLLYGSGTEKVNISEEARFISDYTALEKVRLNDTAVDFEYNASHEQHQIAPLILIPLVENAFKFVSDNATSFLTIRLEVKEGKLLFTVMNTIDMQKQDRTEGGIGLMNLKKRLELYYHGRYQYKTTIEQGIYSAYLSIQLT